MYISPTVPFAVTASAGSAARARVSWTCSHVTPPSFEATTCTTGEPSSSTAPNATYTLFGFAGFTASERSEPSRSCPRLPVVKKRSAAATTPVPPPPRSRNSCAPPAVSFTITMSPKTVLRAMVLPWRNAAYTVSPFTETRTGGPFCPSGGRTRSITVRRHDVPPSGDEYTVAVFPVVWLRSLMPM